MTELVKINQKPITYEGNLRIPGKSASSPPHLFRWPSLSGKILPSKIVLPSENAPKAKFLEIAEEVGCEVRSNYSRSVIRDRIIRAMEYCGYSRSENVLENSEIVQLIQAPPILVETLPAWISISDLTHRQKFSALCSRYPKIFGIFRTKRNCGATDLIIGLIEMGYQQLDDGSFMRNEPLYGQYVYPRSYFDLYEPPDLVNYLRSSEKIIISPRDLQLLNGERFEQLLRKQWDTLNDFVEAATRLGLHPTIIHLFLVLSSLKKKTIQPLRDIAKHLNLIDVKEISGLLRSRIQADPVTFSQRIPTNGPTSPSISLRKAIEEGYTFSYSDYKPELNILLGDHWIPVNYQKAMTQILSEYPELYSKFLKYRSSRYDPLTDVINLFYLYPPNRFQYLYTYTVGYPFLLKESDEQRQRREQLYSLPENYREALFDIYLTGRNLEEVLDKPVANLEKYLLVIRNTSNTGLRALVQGFGMFVPENVSLSEIRDYILNFIGDYREILNRSIDYPRITASTTFEDLRDFFEKAKFMTDFELIAELGYPGPFDNRAVLCDKLYQVNTEKGFTLWQTIDPKRAINDTTTLLTPLTEILPPYLVFGGSYSYRVYECDELNHAFTPNEEGFVEFKDFENPPQAYTEEQINQLIQILPSISSLNPQLTATIDQICASVQLGIQSNRFLSGQGQQFMRNMYKQSDETKELIKQILLAIFHAGMYMRRWQGPGNDYPLLAEHTRSDVDPMPKVSLALAEVDGLVMKLTEINPELTDEFKNLSQVVLPPTGGLVAYTGTPLFDLLQLIGAGRMCIRMASKPLIGSSYHYLAVFFNYLVPGFNPDKLQTIA